MGVGEGMSVGVGVGSGGGWLGLKYCTGFLATWTPFYASFAMGPWTMSCLFKVGSV